MSLAKTLAAALLMTASASAFAQGPNPSEISINSISFAGTGCPAGTVAGNIAPDAKAFTLLFDSYVAEAGPGVSLSEGRKACQLNVDLHIPQGWSYTLFTLDTRGFLNLEPGTSAVQSNKYYFQGSLSGPTLSSQYIGPRVGDYTNRDNIGVAALVWSPCGLNRALNVQTSVRVAAGGGRRAMATVDSIDGEFKLIYGVQWRRC